MLQAVRKNFEEKAAYIARTVPGMAVIEHRSFLAVDCGLPSDTFNVLVVRDMTAPAEVLATVDRFRARGFPLAVWYWESAVPDADRAAFAQHGLVQAETHVAMSADLTHIQVAAQSLLGLEIRRATTGSDLVQFGELLADLFGGASEGQQVYAYFQRLSAYPPSTFPAMRHYLGTLDGLIVATGTLFVGSETAGIYDVVTRDDYRRRGIGSAMFQHLLREAAATSHRLCVLQASPDGLGIYQRAGFKAIGEVHTFEPRQ